MRFIVVASLSLLGCARGLPMAPLSSQLPLATTTCASVSGSQLGALPLTVALGEERIAFAEWSVPDERSTDVVGFAAHLPGGVTFTVKAGDDEFRGASPRWLHPRGISGPRVHPVERITFCRTAAPAVLASR